MLSLMDFPFENNLKNLDLSCKMDLDIGVVLKGKKMLQPNKYLFV